MLHPLPLPLCSCLGCIPPLIGLPSLRFYAVGSSLFLLSVCFCLCSLFYRDDVLCWLLLARPFLYAFHAHLRFPVDLVWFRLSCDHGWIRSGSVNVRKQQPQTFQVNAGIWVFLDYVEDIYLVTLFVLTLEFLTQTRSFYHSLLLFIVVYTLFPPFHTVNVKLQLLLLSCRYFSRLYKVLVFSTAVVEYTSSPLS